MSPVSTVTADEFVHNRQVALFSFKEGDLSTEPGYLGIVAMQSISQAYGSPTPIKVQDPAGRGRMKIVGYTYPDDELPTTSVQERWHRYSLNYLEQVRNERCAQVWIAKVDSCGRRDDLDSWESVMVVEGLLLTNLELSDISADEDGTVPFTGQFTARDFWWAYPARFAERAADEVLSEVLDILYADEISCGSCSPVSDGTQKLYALTTNNSGSPGLSSQLVYSEDGGSTWTRVDIPVLGSNNANRLTSAGNRLIIVSETDEAHVYVDKDDITTTNFVRVDTGYVSGGGPRAVYAGSANKVFMAGKGGYIYSSTSPTTSVSVVEDGTNTSQDANDIHGQGTSIIVSVHNSNAIQFSTNGGRTFQLLVSKAGLNGPEAGANLTCVWVVDQYHWWVGTNTGKLWYTQNQGQTWTQQTQIAGASVINDIKFTPDRASHGALACEVGGEGKIYRTVSGGRSWYTGAPAIAGVPACDRINAIALADVYAIAGGGLNGSDGIIMVSEAVE